MDRRDLRQIVSQNPILDSSLRKLVAEVTYLNWTEDGLLRHTVLVGLREDKPSKDVRREAPSQRC